MLTATAASPVVSQLLTNAAAEAGAATEDVVAGGRHAVALGSSVLPLLIAGILTALAAVGIASAAWAGPEWWRWPRCSPERSRP